jgi:hypothetical protein
VTSSTSAAYRKRYELRSKVADSVYILTLLASQVGNQVRMVGIYSSHPGRRIHATQRTDYSGISVQRLRYVLYATQCHRNLGSRTVGLKPGNPGTCTRVLAIDQQVCVARLQRGARIRRNHHEWDIAVQTTYMASKI